MSSSIERPRLPVRARRYARSIFISHGKRDVELAAALSEMIKKVSSAIFVCQSSDCLIDENVPFGGHWYRDIGAWMHGMGEVISLLTSRSIDDPWLFWEAGFCRGRKRRHLAFAFHLTEKEARIGPFAREEIRLVDKRFLQEWLTTMARFHGPSPRFSVEKATLRFLEEEERIHSSAVTQLPPLRRHRMRSGQETE